MACKQQASVLRLDGLQTERSKEIPDESPLSQQVEHVVRTWALVKNDMLGNGIVFYDRLFSENPELKSLFSFTSNNNTGMTCDDPGLKRQAKMLMSMIDYAIRRLGNLPELIPKLKNLGKRHFVNYNVKPEHFQAVGSALLWTLKKGLGDEMFTSEVEAAWFAIYSILADIMIEGGKDGLAENNKNGNKTSESTNAAFEAGKEEISQALTP